MVKVLGARPEVKSLSKNWLKEEIYVFLSLKDTIAKSKKIFLKISNSAILLLLNANFFIPIDWF